MCEHLHTSTWRTSGAFFSAAVVNICKRVPKVGRWLNGGEPDSSTSVPDGAKGKLKDWAGAEPQHLSGVLTTTQRPLEYRAVP